jgi:hypothetical protein
MKPREIVIALVWLALLASALTKGLAVGHTKNPPGTVAPFPPVGFAFFALPLFFVFSAAAAFFQRRRLHRGWWLQELIDSKWGAGTYDEFLVRLKPTALMMLYCLTLGFVGLASTYANEQNWFAYFNSSFFLSCGLGLLTAYLLSYRFPPRLH